MQRIHFAAAVLLALTVGNTSDAAIHAVRLSPFDFSQPKSIEKPPSLIKKILRWVDGGGDLHTKDPDPARRAPENTAHTKTIRFKFYF